MTEIVSITHAGRKTAFLVDGTGCTLVAWGYIHGRRKLDMEDVFQVVATAAACRAYERVADHDGTCWRVTGPTVDGELVAIGVEAYLDKKRRRCILCTIFRQGE